MVLMPGLKGKYDAWNRLVEVRDASDNLIAEYSYNGMNQRISKEIGNVTTNSFFNENWQEMEATKEAGVSTPAETTTYVWGLRYIDDLICREKGAEKLYSLADPNWNVVATTDSTGTVVERMKYDAFGKITWLDEDFDAKNESDFAWNRTFTGQVYDSETGLMIYRSRYYHTRLGRFVSRDPIEYQSDDYNLYRYVNNTPTTLTDPFGYAWFWPVARKCAGYVAKKAGTDIASSLLCTHGDISYKTRTGKCSKYCYKYGDKDCMGKQKITSSEKVEGTSTRKYEYKCDCGFWKRTKNDVVSNCTASCPGDTEGESPVWHGADWSGYGTY